MELWDAYDRNFNKLDGVALVRGEPIPEGQYHLVCEVIVRHADGSYLLMQRDPRKIHGGMWEATAGGSALQGESASDCALRELREETGISAEHLTEIGRLAQDRNHSIYVEYLCITNCDKDAVTLQEGETVAWRWVSREALRAMPKQELVTYRIQQFIPELR